MRIRPAAGVHLGEARDGGQVVDCRVPRQERTRIGGGEVRERLGTRRLGDAARRELLRHAVAADLVHLVERDQRVAVLRRRDAGGVEQRREHLAMVQAE